MRRSSFLVSSAAVVASAYLRGVTLAAATESEPSLVPILETLFPFQSREFPRVTSSDLNMRIETLFRLSESQAFRSSLASFLNVTSFPAATPALFAAERSHVPNADAESLAASDARAFRAAVLEASDFAALTLPQRQTYMWLWARSAMNVRRRFYFSVRAVSLEALYSMPSAWESIGYDGPLLHREPEQ